MASSSFLPSSQAVKLYSQKHNILKDNEANLLIAKTTFMIISGNVVLFKTYPKIDRKVMHNLQETCIDEASYYLSVYNNCKLAKFQLALFTEQKILFCFFHFRCCAQKYRKSTILNFVIILFANYKVKFS